MKFPYVYAVKFEGEKPFYWDFAYNRGNHNATDIFYAGCLTDRETALLFLSKADSRYRLVKFSIKEIKEN